MGIRNFEIGLWKEAKEVFKNPNLRLKDLLEWRSTPFEAVCTAETVAKLPSGFWVSIETQKDRRTEDSGAIRDR